jgi:hypothetical protein
MSAVTSTDVRVKEAAEVAGVTVDFTALLDHDNSVNETISSVTSVTADPAGPTISSPAVTTVHRKCNGRNVVPGKGITFTVSGGTNGTDYDLICVVVTSEGQTRKRKLPLEVRAS